MLKKWFGLASDPGCVQQAQLMLQSLEGQPLAGALQTLGDWLDEMLPRALESGESARVVLVIDEPARRLMSAALHDMLDCFSNPIRLNLLCSLVQRVTTVLELGFEYLIGKEPAVLAKLGSKGHAQVYAGYFYWMAHLHVVDSIKRPRTEAFPWANVYGQFETAVTALPDQKLRLQARMAYLLLMVRSLGSSLNGRQMLIAERIIDVVAAFLDTSPESDSGRAVGLKSDQDRVTLLTTIPTQQGNVVFFGMDRCLLELDALERSLYSKNQVPEKYDPAGQLEVAETLAVIKHLRAKWSGRRIKRNAPRYPAEGNLHLVYDYQAIFWRLAHAQQAQPLGNNLDNATSSSAELVDESATGCGMLLRINSHWARVGMLLLLRKEQESQWSVGMIRRLILNDDGRLMAGCQLFSVHPEAVRLQTPVGAGSKTMTMGSDPRTSQSAVFLPATPLVGNHASLVMQAATLKVGQMFVTASPSLGNILLKVTQQHEIGSGFVHYLVDVSRLG